jgi:serine phosphatase RsbU (regulator of sigma subunit)/anti-sigma regulatory factor (Ser/Thr protein kinase)
MAHGPKGTVTTGQDGEMTDTGFSSGAGEDLRAMPDWALSQSSLNVALYDAQMRLLRINATMCQMLGLKTEAAGVGHRLTELFPDLGFETFEATGRQVMHSGVPAVWEGFGKAPGEDRGRAWSVSMSVVKNSRGFVCGVMCVGFEITEHRRARKRLAVINDASSRIGGTLDMTTTAEELVEVAIPRFADVAMIDIQESVLRGDEPTGGPATGTVPLRRMAFGSVLDGAPEVVTRPGQVASYPAGSPAAAALASARPVLHDSGNRDVSSWAAADPVRTDKAVRYGFHSILAVPLLARGATFGVAIFVRHRRPEGFEQDDLAMAEEIVARAAVCIDNARRYALERATALTLQRSLLQQHLPAQAAVSAATRYLPGQSGLTVGGDWSDVIALSGSRVALVVGDVAGHGIRAAATMGRLRTAVRTLADIDLDPGELLTRLDDVIMRLADEDEPASEAADLTATCLFAVYDPISRRCTLASAGHPVPAVVTPGGESRFLDLPAGPPLGVGGVPFEETEIELPQGSVLVLYTDGLVESRERDMDTGMSAMQKVLSEAHGRPGEPPAPLDAVCDSLVEVLVPGPAADDAALLIARTRALPSGQVVTWDLPAEPEIVSEARARATRQVAAWGLEELTFTTELLVSELLTNAIRHARPPIQLRMILDTVLSCEVSDASVAAPHHRRADRYDEGGRGLMLVARLAARWGTRHTRTGKTIWAQQPLPHQESQLHSRAQL